MSRGAATSPPARRPGWLLLAAALLLLGVPLVRPTVRWVDPGAAVRAAGHGELFQQIRWSWRLRDEVGPWTDPVDPWGRPWALIERVGPYGGVTQRWYSVGPNGLDEGGEGDDIGVYDDRVAFSPVAAGLYLWGRDLLVALALLLLGWRSGRAALVAPRAERTSREVLRALALAVPPVGVLCAGVVVAANWFTWPSRLLEVATHLVAASSPLDVSPLVTLAGSLGFMTFLAAMAYRLRLVQAFEPTQARHVVRRADAVVLGCALVLLVQAPLVKALWRALSPRMLAVQAYQDMLDAPFEAWDTSRDPWGTPWCGREPPVLDGETWSAGPNRVDEGMRGDDIVVAFVFGSRIDVDHVYLAAPTLLVLAALLLAGGWAAARPFARRLITRPPD
ncbi:MAG: hypothetical protein KF878_21000 [Planctomycetes bacterium]|nr:hypothetical protein [Planctomycetota bacterium]